MDKEQPAAGAGPFKFVTQLGFGAGLIGGWVVLIGWFYAYYYFLGFGVGVNPLGLGADVLMRYGVATLLGSLKETIAALAVLALLAWWIGTRPGSGLPGSLVVFLTAVAVLAALLGAAEMAQRRASHSIATLVRNDFSPLPNVRVWMKASWADDERLARIASELSGTSCYRLLFESKDALYVFRQLKGKSSPSPVLVIPRAAGLKGYRVSTRYSSCGQQP